jgi:hypothetical protein
MKKINFLSFLFAIVFSNLYGQTFHLYENNQFETRKISVGKFKADTLEIKCFLEPIGQYCACESYEIYALTKNQFGNYCSQDGYIQAQANLYDGKIKSILINSCAHSHCCDVFGGNYLVKPTPPSGSKNTPKLSTVNAAPKQFYDFWNTFKAKMNNTDSIKPLIHFPYGLNCNYLDVKQITLEDFSKYGTEVFGGGNAFIKNTFSDYAYPKNKGLFFGQMFCDEGSYLSYISEELKNHFITQFGNLNGIYVVSELSDYYQASGYKAYFRAKDDSFEFIGFEGLEQGD